MSFDYKYMIMNPSMPRFSFCKKSKEAKSRISLHLHFFINSSRSWWISLECFTHWEATARICKNHPWIICKRLEVDPKLLSMIYMQVIWVFMSKIVIYCFCDCIKPNSGIRARLYAYRSVVKISEFYDLVWICYDFYKLYHGLIMINSKLFLKIVLTGDLGSTSVVDRLGIFFIIFWCID